MPWRVCRAEARHSTPRSAGAGPPELERLVGKFQHGLSGGSRERGGEWCESLAREGEPAHLSASVSALARGRDPSWARDQRSPYANLGLGSGRRFVDGSLWQGPLAGDKRNYGARHSASLRLRALEISH